MADEQPIYVSPQEELTSVLERLARTQARHITLVIPSQTQLHSHTGWRLIHARMREMGKELLVISPDRQVQALASAAGFKVAARLDGTSSTQTRSGGGSRSGISNPRNGSRSRVGGSRGGSESQSTQQRRPTPISHKRSLQPPPQLPPDFEDESTLERPGKRPARPRPSQPIAPAQPFEPPESKFGAAYDFPIDTTPSLRPAPLPFEEDEDDDDDALQRKYADDYQEAQNIRASASKGPVMPEEKRAATGRRKTDPYAHLEDDQPHSRLPEQRGSLRSPVEEVGMGVPDLADYSTEIMPGQIEDLGDQGALDLPISKLERDLPAPREREQGLRPRARTGQMQPTTRHSPRAPRPGSQDFEDDDDLLALPSQSSQAPRPSRGLGGTAGRPPSRGLAGAQPPRPSQGLRPAGAAPRPSQTLKPTGAASQAGSRRPASVPIATTAQRAPNRQLMSRPAPSGSGRQASRPQSGPRRKGGGLRIFFGVVLVLLCVALALFYFVPTATVTITLQARAFSQKVQLTALTNPQANMPGAVAATKLQANFSATGQAKATGSTRVGNSQAQGWVTFTNNGNADVTIPTGTIVTTQSGLVFVTGAEAVIPYGGNVPPPPVPVTAQQSGDNGNVSAHSITTIPTSSVSSIAQYNKVSSASIKLTVDNPQATSGGGALNEPAVASGDVQGLEKSLHQKLQQQITTWLNQHVHSGDVHGTTVPDVLGNANPISAEKLSGAPAVGQAVKSGTFSGTFSVQISVLVARTSDLQKAAGAQLNTAALKQSPPSILATQLPVTLASVKSTTSADGNSLSITAQASGSIIQQVSSQAISDSLTGKGITQAKSELQSSMARAGFLRVQISVSPGFLTNLPLIAGHIQVILKPIQPTPPKHVPNG